MTDIDRKKETTVWRGRAFLLYPIQTYIYGALGLVALSWGDPFIKYMGWGWSTLLLWILWLTIISIIAKCLWTYLVIANEHYELTLDELRICTGVINKRVDSLEVLRIKDIVIFQPFYFKPFNKAIVILKTSDRSHPIVRIKGTTRYKELKDFFSNKIRENLEQSLILE